MINKCLKYLFWICFMRPLVMIVIGLNVRHRERLPKQGPCIIIANHNSHLDTAVLVSLFPLTLLNNIRSVAAAEYFLRNRLLAWFSTKIIGIIPILRGKVAEGIDPFVEVRESLDRGDIVIIFPEGTRGEPEQFQSFKRGISFLAKQRPDVPIVPIFLHGLGKSLPKNEALFVPFFCDVFVGESFYWTGDQEGFMALVKSRFDELSQEGKLPAWL